MSITMTPAKLSALAQSRQKLNTFIAWLFSLVALGVVLALLYNIYRVEQPWIRVGQAWTLGVFVWLFLGVAGKGRPRVDPGQPCAEFLHLQHEERRHGYLLVRNRIFLFLPGIAACWCGAHSIIAPRSLWLASLPWLFLSAAAGLVLVWIGFGKAAEKAGRERDEILQNLAG